jgi:hypothetical protein
VAQHRRAEQRRQRPAPRRPGGEETNEGVEVVAVHRRCLLHARLAANGFEKPLRQRDHRHLSLEQLRSHSADFPMQGWEGEC